jgi:hypothetical protein
MKSDEKIIQTIKKVCEEEGNMALFGNLEKIFHHISKHDNQPEKDRITSIKKIIDYGDGGGIVP